ncbi:RHS repeat-associated core domain-containing protein [Xylophilus sp. GW821-FHT01B05]
MDLQAKVLGGYVRISRTWTGGRWYVNSAWATLAFVRDPLDQGVKAINRAGALYERSGTSDVYIFDGVLNDQVFIRKTSTGWRWYDRAGNWITYDAAGRITAYGDSNDVKVQFVLDGAGQRMAIRDHLGNTVFTFTYQNDRLTSVQDRAGRQVLYTWTGERLTQVTDVRGGRWLYQYDAKGQLTRRTDPAGGTIQIAYADSVQAPPPAMDSGKTAGQESPTSGIVTTGSSSSTTQGGAGRVGTLTDELGATTVWNTAYDRINRQYTVTSQMPDGQSVVRRYDKDGRLFLQSVNGVARITVTRDGKYMDKYTDARGLSSTIEYDGNRQPLKITYPDGTTDSFAYDSVTGRPVRHTNALGVATSFDYDSKGNLVRQTEAQGKPAERVTTWVYDAYGQPSSVTVGTGGNAITVRSTYDGYGNVASLTNGEGAVDRYTHNVLGQPLTHQDALGHSWLAEYDSAGNFTKAVDPLGHATVYTLDAVGRVTEARNPLGQTARYSYNAKGQVTSQTNALQGAWAYQYDNMGRWTRMSSPSGLALRQEYDAEGRPLKRIDPAGNATQYEYGTVDNGLQGLLAARIYPTYREEYRYDQRQRMTQVAQVLDAATRHTTRLGYDAVGQLISHTGADGAATLVQYDTLGRKVQATDALGGKTRQEWDTFSRPVLLADAAGNPHRFEYDKAGRLRKETRPGGGATTYAYDAVGQLIRRTEAAGNSVEYRYDAARRRTAAIYTAAGQTSPSQTVTYGYDDAGWLRDISQTGDTVTRFVYTRDALGRKTQEVITYGSGPDALGKTLQYSYDADGNKTGLTYPDGSRLGFSYELGRLKSAQLPNSQAIAWGGYQWQVPTQVNFPGATETIGYDPLQRTRRIQVAGANGSVLDRSLAYDAAGNITRRQTEDGSFAYGYDRLGRLTQATPPAALQRGDTRPDGLPLEQYSYDAVDNRTSSAHQPGAWVYNADNQLLQWGVGSEQTTARYNANGNLDQQTYGGQTRHHVYNAVDRLVEIRDDQGLGARYSYDPLGRRISKSFEGKTTWYVYSDEGLVAEFDAQGKLAKAYGWQPGSTWGTAPLWQAEPAAGQGLGSADYHYLHTDHLGTPQLATDGSGQTSWKGQSEAFGKTTPEGSSRIAVNLRLPGQYWDAEVGTHYNRFRDYQPAMGRYIQADPIGVEGGGNQYLYANDTPLMFTDPLGLYTEVVVWQGVGMGSSSFGHVSTNVNGQNFSWGPGGWDTQSATAAEYNRRQQDFRGGNGVMLSLSSQQEATLASCMRAQTAAYNAITNNCGNPVQQCLNMVGAGIGNSVLPSSILENLRSSPNANGNVSYPSPRPSGGAGSGFGGGLLWR